MNNLAMGIDLGSSGIRIAIVNIYRHLIYNSSIEYSHGLEECDDWIECCTKLILNIPKEIKTKIKSCSIAGTSGTLLAASLKGEPIDKAIAYNTFHPKENKLIRDNIPNLDIDLEINSSIGRASKLVAKHGTSLILRHQSDWVSGWLLDNWQNGEEGNNLKLGWDVSLQSWPKSFTRFAWRKCLPKIVESGTILGEISSCLAKKLELPLDLLIVAGTTDSNAAVLATNPKEYEGVTILGSTIVLKKFVKDPIISPGISNHKLLNQWICGGASNTGGNVLKKFFNSDEIEELSKQINPKIESGMGLLPLPSRGERFPIYDPNLEPILEPRPVSDCLYLQALLEGLARIEADGWEKLNRLGVELPKKIITIGGGAKNTTWKRIREKIIGIPTKTCLDPPAMGVALIALSAII